MNLQMKKIAYLLISGLLAFGFLASIPGIAVASDRIKVSVSVLPQAYFVERIGGDRVTVQVMIPRGASPAIYEPTPQQLIMLADSKIYVKVGAPTFPFEKKHFNSILKKNRKMIVVNMSDGVEYRNSDPHVWVAPCTVRIAAGNIYNALSEIDPSGKSYYRKKFESFLRDIDELDGDIRTLLAGKKGYSFMVFHPAWGYFADQYGLKQVPVEAGRKAPSASRIKKIVDTAREKGIRVIFVQKGFDVRSAKIIAAEIGGKVMEIDPLEKDWLKNMKDIAETLSNVLKR